MNAETLNEGLVARWIADEAVASGILSRESESYVFYGDKNDFKVEIKVFTLPKRTVRLVED